MTDKPENPPAYPFVLPTKYRIAEAGMTLRDWFAGQALVGLMFRADSPAQRNEIADMVYAIADAMLQQREK